MKILIRHARILHKGHAHHNLRRDILIEDGVISDVAEKIDGKADHIFQSPHLHCSPGWLDIGTHLGEPGYEHRETTETLCRAALAGGYTSLAPFSSTDPIIQTAADIGYIKKLFHDHPVKVYPIGALSRNLEGREVTEMRDMIRQGAVAFSDGLRGIHHAGLILRALEYLYDRPEPIIHFPMDERLFLQGQVHEGKVSVEMGLNGIPGIAESTLAKRDIDLAQYTGKNLILHAISLAETIHNIQNARKAGVRIHGTVSYMNLILNDLHVKNFDPNYKVLPPLRDKNNNQLLQKALLTGGIEAIVSNHVPLEEERKKLEFPYADFGCTGLETCYAALNSSLKPQFLEPVVHTLSIGPRNLLHVPVPSIEAGQKAEITLFDPKVQWTFHKSNSLSSNNPFIGMAFTGKVVGTVMGKEYNELVLH